MVGESAADDAENAQPQATTADQLEDRFATDIAYERANSLIPKPELPMVAERALAELAEAVSGWDRTDRVDDGGRTIRVYKRNGGGASGDATAWLKLSEKDGRVVEGGYLLSWHNNEYQMGASVRGPGGARQDRIYYNTHPYNMERDANNEVNTYGAAARATALAHGVVLPLTLAPKPEPQPEPEPLAPPAPVPLPWRRLRRMSPDKQLAVPVAVPERLRDPAYLPTYAEVQRVFRFEPANPEYGRLTDFSRFLPQVFGETQGMPGVNEYYTREYISELGSYMVDRLRQLGGTPERPIQMLEIAAGQGRLSYFLRQELNRRLEEANLGPIYQLATTDLYPASAPNRPQLSDIEALGYEEALQKYNPQIVLAAWMPNAEKRGQKLVVLPDWTETIRATDSVQEYVMIGDPDEHGPKAFGRTPRKSRGFFWKRTNEPEAVVTKDGFVRRDMPQLSRYQIGYTDTVKGGRLSQTVSFRRAA